MKQYKDRFDLLTILLVAFVCMGFISCSDDDDNNSSANKEKTDSELILGTWNFTSDNGNISITFFDNGTYAHFDYKYFDDYSGFYRLTNDSIIFTIVQSKNISYNRSVGIKELSDNSLVFEGYDSQRISSGIIYNGVYRGTREKNVDEKTAVKYRKDIIGDWKVTYDLYGTMTSTLRINDNGTFVFYDEKPSDGYNGTYSICDDKLLFVEDSQKCPIGGLYKIKELTDNRFVLTDMYEDEITGYK